MASDVETLVSQRMLDAKGKWGAFGPASFPIDASDIRRWAIAVHWPEPPPRLYWDEEYAQSTRWGGIIAPPEFNPFAWPIPGNEGPRELSPDMPAEDEPGRNLMNGGSSVTYGVPMRQGDQIRARRRLRDWNEREGRFGLMLFSNSESEWVNQRDERVRLTVSTLIRY